jgi:hypothetical protein
MCVGAQRDIVINGQVCRFRSGTTQVHYQKAISVALLCCRSLLFDDFLPALFTMGV